MRSIILLFIAFALASCAKEQAKPKAQPFFPQIAAHKKVPEKQKLNELYVASRPLIISLNLGQHQQISFEQMKQLARAKARTGRQFARALQPTLEWLEYIETKSVRLKNLFDFPYQWQAALVPRAVEYHKFDNAYVTAFQASMFRHCRASFQAQTGHRLKLTSGYRSPAYQLYLTAFLPGSLEEVFQRAAPPFYSRHQGVEPDLSISLESKKLTAQEEFELLSQIPQHCAHVGFGASFPGNPDLRYEYFTTNQEDYYAPLYDGDLDPELLTDVEEGMILANFYPSRKGVKLLMALSWKESSWHWNPQLIASKKELLHRRFDELLTLAEQGLTGRLTSFLLPKKLAQHKQRLKTELTRITAAKDYSITEWDVYLWTRDLLAFFRSIEGEYRSLSALGGMVVDVESQRRKLEHEPQTFGLWQVNVNHLQEKLLQEQHQWKKKYPMLYQGRFDRDGLIRSLSGLEAAPLDRATTLALLFDVWLAPRYWDHQLGQEGDLLFFAAEHLSGPLSTYKAAFQERLSELTRAKLTPDGDLARSMPYSMLPDLKKPSHSKDLLSQYLRKLNLPSIQQRREIKEIVRASSLAQLRRARAYQRVMGKQAGRRSFPVIQSKLHGQSPRSYAFRVVKLAETY